MQDYQDLNTSIIFHNAILSVDKNDTFSIQNLGYLYRVLKDSSNAFKYLNQALAMNPEDSISFLNKCRVYAIYRDTQTLACMNENIYKHPFYIQQYIDRSFFYENMLQYDKSISDLKYLLSFYPQQGYADIYNRIGLNYIKLKNVEEACINLKLGLEYAKTFKDNNKNIYKNDYKQNCK